MISCPFYAVAYFLSGNSFCGSVILGGAAIFGPIIYLLLKNGHFFAAKLTLIAICSLYVYMISYSLGHDGHGQMYLFAIITLIFLIIDTSKKRRLAAALAFPLGVWLAIQISRNADFGLIHQPQSVFDFGLNFEFFGVTFLVTTFLFLSKNVQEHYDTIKHREYDSYRQELASTNAQLDRFFNLGPLIQIIGNAKGFVTRTNKVFPALLGITEEELKSHRLLEWIHPDDWAASIEIMKKSAEGVSNFENRYRCKDGSYRVLNWCWQMDRETGEIYALARDMTDELWTRHEKTQLFTAIEKSAIVTITDAHGKILSVNDMFCKVSGYSREELIGKDHRVVNSGAHPKAYFKEMWQTIKSGQSWIGDIENRAKDGSHYFVSTAITPIFDQNGSIEKFLSIRFDRTKERELHIALENERAKVIDVNRLNSLGDMAANIAHEINNPLTIIAGGLLHLKKCKSDEAAFNETYEKIQRSIFRINRIIKEIGFYGSAGDDEYTDESVTDLVETAFVLVKGKVEHASISVQFTFDDDCFIHCSRTQILQALTHLFSNAIDATEPLVNRWIKVHAYEVDAEVVIRIIDSGRGVAREIQEKMFDPFFTTKDVGKGMGLGLFVTKGILETHNATIRVGLHENHTAIEIRFQNAKGLTKAA